MAREDNSSKQEGVDQRPPPDERLFQQQRSSLDVIYDEMYLRLGGAMRSAMRYLEEEYLEEE